MNNDVQPQTNEDEEIALLDLLLVFVQNLRLLVLGPLLVGAGALGVAWLLPLTFESKAVQSGDATLAAMYNSAQVRDAIIQQTGYAYAGEDADKARLRLEADLKVSYNAKDKTISLVAAASSPAQAQQLAQAAIQAAAKLNASRLANLQRLNEQFESASKREREYAAAADKLVQQMANASAASQALLVQSQAQLLDAARNAQITTTEIGDAIQKAENFDLLQQPTLPTQKSKPKKALIAIIATLASGFALLLFVFVRQALRNGSQDEETAKKLAAIRTGWKRAIGKA
jgi:uncharacterized protein involved in exopolysaccharide biosynthesis